MPIGFTNLSGVSHSIQHLTSGAKQHCHLLIKRTPTLRKKLRQRHPFRTMHERKHFRDVHVSQWMHDRVEHIVDEDHAHDCARGLRVLRHGVVGARAGPAGEDGGHADESDQVLRAAGEFLGEEGACHAGDEVPAGEAQVDLVLFAAVGDADCCKDFG